MNSIFELRNTKFSYSGNPENAVLHVEELNIPEGKIIFLLGGSGTGKSTILEALGLMNDTIASGEVRFNPGEGDPVNVKGLWDSRSSLFNLRRKSFSFIFQNTNLMENFSAYENVSLPQMVQLGVRHDAAVLKAKTYMNDVGLTESVVDSSRKSSQLSGGQRQRLSFVRALSSDFRVIFCDEPTGNLDMVNAKELFKVIRKSVNPESKRSAIVVSHDIELAMEFADVIIGIQKDTNGKGFIGASCIFDMKHSDPMLVRDKMLQLYNSGKQLTSAKSEEIGSKPVNVKPFSFNQLFLLREGKALSGRGFANFIILASIFFLTFLALGFSNGSFSYLEEKMSNPFVRWVTIPIPFMGDVKDIEELKLKISSDSIMSKFKIAGLSTYSKTTLEFFTSNERDRKSVQARARTFEFVNNQLDPLATELVQAQNLEVQKAGLFHDPNELGVIVTSRFLRQLGYESYDVPFLSFRSARYSSQLDSQVIEEIPIPIIAVVKDIPGRIDVGISEGFFLALRDASGNGPLNPENFNSISFFIDGDREGATQASKDIRKFINTERLSDFIKVEKLIPMDNTVQSGFQCKLTCLRPLEKELFKDSVYNLVAEKFFGKTSSFMGRRIYDFSEVRIPSQGARNGDELSLQFAEMEKIEPFANWLYYLSNGSGKEYSLEIDTSKVREKKNFMFLSHVLQVIAGLLILFSAISICLFISNLLKMHLEKVKMNIGTFMAFGLSDSKVQRIYFSIIIGFIFGALSVSLGVSLIASKLLDSYFVNEIIKEPGVTFCSILEIRTYVVLLIIFAVSLLVSLFTIKRMLAKTPGDLIYNR